MRHSIILFLVALLLLAGCTRETQTTWEQCPQHRHLVGTEIPADPDQPGTTRFVYPDRKPIANYSAPGQPQQITVTYQNGIHVNVYAANGDLVSHDWQPSKELAP
jgi:hypothetical protein